MPSQDNLYARVSDFDAMEADLKATRQYLHANPELSFEEAETARYVADKLEAWGYDVTRNVGGHGVVAVLKNGTGTKSIGIRADMDALPITEETGCLTPAPRPARCMLAAMTATPPFCSAPPNTLPERDASTAP
jgi:hippurate hydrolase